MGYTVGEAAKATGKSKGTISKAIKEGRLTAEKNMVGDRVVSFDIDESELHRVWPKVFAKQPAESLGEQVENTGNAMRINRLEVELQAEREKSAGLVDQLADTRQDRDHWRSQATALVDMRARPSIHFSLIPRLKQPKNPIGKSLS